MSKSRGHHRCHECGAVHLQWAGRCDDCGGWNTLIEVAAEAVAAAGRAVTFTAPVPITEIDATCARPVPTGISEVDRVLGGGLVGGSVTLLGGEPGIGKSTLLLQLCIGSTAAGRRVLYLTGEESGQQVQARARRLGALSADLLLGCDTRLPAVIAAIQSLRPDLVFVDSVQTLEDPELSSAAGSVTQLRRCVHQLVNYAKANDTTMVLVGHVNKDGDLAGPRVLEHLVDTVLSLEGDRHHGVRMLRAVKHRFGPTGELGVFEMVADGLVEVADPSGLFLADRLVGVPGSAVVPLIEGCRPLLAEVQALVASSGAPLPRRSAQGLDGARLSMLVAVLEQRAGLRLSGLDLYASVMGGVRLADPGGDLSVALAVASALTGTAVPGGLVACAEIGLSGELRQVPHLQRRLAEAARLGFRRAIVPSSVDLDVDGIAIDRCATVAEALNHSLGHLDVSSYVTTSSNNLTKTNVVVSADAANNRKKISAPA